MHNTRRDFLQRSMGFLVAAAVPSGVHAVLPTPRQTAGPFYPLQAPLDDDNDLVHVAGQETVAKGAITDLTGRLNDIRLLGSGPHRRFCVKLSDAGHGAQPGHRLQYAAQIAKLAYKQNLSLREAALRLGLLSGEDFDRQVRPRSNGASLNCALSVRLSGGY